MSEEKWTESTKQEGLGAGVLKEPGEAMTRGGWGARLEGREGLR